MYQKERLDEILEILKASGYVTVKYLTERLHYSTATVN
ncbi:MAG: DeoR family transcriptional regulator [Clostridia bacterium]|nr:DeoR family transcriptional regulator [Clostridia bacterium]